MGVICEFDSDSARASNPVLDSGRLRPTVQTVTRNRLARGRTRTTLPTANLNSDLPEMIGVTRLPGLWVQCFLFRHSPDCSPMHVPILCRRGAGDPRAPTPDRYRSARRQQTTALDPSRPGVVGCFFPESGGTGARHWLSSNQRL